MFLIIDDSNIYRKEGPLSDRCPTAICYLWMIIIKAIIHSTEENGHPGVGRAISALNSKK